MTLQNTPTWKTYKRHLRSVINHHISQALGDLTKEEREHTAERVKQVTKRLDTFVATYMTLANIAQRGKKNEQKQQGLEGSSRTSPSRGKAEGEV